MSFADTLRGCARRRGLALSPPSHPEPLAALPYDAERALKDEAMQAFWADQGLPGHPQPVAAAPSPRGYRTTTKRRAVNDPRGLSLAFPGAAPMRGAVTYSSLDRPEHRRVYEIILERLRRPSGRSLAAVLNWVIVRGSGEALSVILNVRVFDAGVVRAGKQTGEALRGAQAGVRAAFLYLDPSGSDYYLEARRPAGTLAFKRLFGPDWLQVEVGGVRLRFGPTVFSQVNGDMLETMVATAGTLLAPVADASLLDLYCGYGLFSFTVGRCCSRVLGVDAAGPAIEAARGNAEHLRCAPRVRFLAGGIDGELLARRLRPPRDPELVLLDPPRQGTASGVVEALADRSPRRVVHICCGTDEIPREVSAWMRAGYRLERAVPLDLFPGTSGLETMMLLTR